MSNQTHFTSESVTEGHPDKVCDFISDTILDAHLSQDPDSRVACEVCATTDFVLVMGEITSAARVDIEQAVRGAIREIGYTQPGTGFDADSCTVEIRLDKQSPDIAMGVDAAEMGAGDQGLMFGYATNQTASYMPLPIDLAHKLTRRLAFVRKGGALPYLRPDGKSQVTVAYDASGNPQRIEAVVLSAQHDESVSQQRLAANLKDQVLGPVLPARLLDADTKVFINPTGRFVVGGPHGDSGLTGRKIIVDTYGGYVRHGGGAFSGKDPTKVDRSASYAARYAAKNLVAAGLAAQCEIQLSYAIGVARPTSVRVDTFGSGQYPDAELAQLVRQSIDLRPGSIISRLNLRRPIYRQTAAYGHFGRDDLDLPWERCDAVEALLMAARG